MAQYSEPENHAMARSAAVNSLKNIGKPLGVEPYNIRGMLDMLEKELHVLGERISDHHEMLSPVLGPEPDGAVALQSTSPHREDSQKALVAPRSQVVDRLHGLQKHAQALSVRLKIIAERLEV